MDLSPERSRPADRPSGQARRPVRRYVRILLSGGGPQGFHGPRRQGRHPVHFPVEAAGMRRPGRPLRSVGCQPVENTSDLAKLGKTRVFNSRWAFTRCRTCPEGFCERRDGALAIHGHALRLKPPTTNDRTNSTRKTRNRIFAIPAAVPAIPPKPKRAAIRAMIRNVMAQLNIGISSVVSEC